MARRAEPRRALAQVDQAELDAWLQTHLAAAPPLTKGQRESIAALLARSNRDRRRRATTAA